MFDRHPEWHEPFGITPLNYLEQPYENHGAL
jgi:hypothetical protein